jgi:uncharacterized protein YndB with AHSA1/START domain
MTMSTMRAVDVTHGAVRVEEIYDTDIDYLWQACTTPARLARWIAEVSGDLRLGGTILVTFTSTGSGPARIEACDAPHHLLLRTEPGTAEEGEIEAWLHGEGARTRLVVEERGLALDKLHIHGAGWQAHLEDLSRTLASGGSVHPEGWSEQVPSPDWKRRWTELIPLYESMELRSPPSGAP